MRRLAIYVFWEQNGIVRDYVSTYLKGLMTVAEKLYVVVNGEICPKGKQRIEQETGAVVLQRSNEGVDFWAYKTALEQEGAGVSAYDEIILCNCSCYGPVYPFEEMFGEMGKRNVDFWGITEWPMNAGGYQGTWLLSYFLVFRPHIFLSPEWTQYWRNLSPVYSREECIEKHETKFTAYFAEKGFTYDVYCCNTPGYLDITIEAPDELVIEQHCPIIKRKAFCVDYGRFLPYRRGNAARRVFNYIREHDLYNTDQILDDLLATQHGAYLRDCLQLYYVLPSICVEPAPQKMHAAICFQMSHEELLDENFQVLCVLPPSVDCYISTPVGLVEAIRKKAATYGISNYTVLESTGFSGAMGILFRLPEHLIQYDCVCAIHDGYTPGASAHCVDIETRRFVINTLLASTAHVESVQALFSQEPRLGLLSPVDTLHGNHSAQYGQEWGSHYPGTIALMQRAGIDVPISESVPPVAPLEGMFWFRPIALRKLLELKLREDEFAIGNADGTLYDAVLRSLPYFAQEAGFLSGKTVSALDASNHIANLSYLYRQDNLALCGAAGVVYVQIGVRGALKNYLKRHLPKGLVNFLRRICHGLQGR